MNLTNNKKQPYNFAYKDTEKCRNYWYFLKRENIATIAFLEMCCVRIEIELEVSVEGGRSVQLRVIHFSKDCDCCFNGYIRAGVKESLSSLHSWDEVEDYLYDQLINYCKVNDINYTKNFVDNFIAE